MNVILFRDDIEQHDECDCGLCDNTGKSWGVGIFKAPKDHDSDLIDDDAFDKIVRGECQERAYGRSPEAAMEAARYVCQQNGWNVL